MPRTRLLLRVAGEETTRYFRGFNPRVLVFLAIAAAIGAVLLPQLLHRGVVPDQHLYRAEYDPYSPLAPPLLADRQFEATPGVGARFSNGEAELLISGTSVYYAATDRGRAAIHDFAAFTERYWDNVLPAEANQTAAFPVEVNVVYEPRQLSAAQLNQGQAGPPPQSGPPTHPNTSLVLQQSGETHLALTPGRVEPPFPMKSLLLTFVYLVPLNFVSQYYAGSLLAERTKNRGILLLSAPLTGPQILAGKTLPYLVFACLYGVVATLLLRAGPMAFLATLPIVAFFLSATAFAALLARSYRELTFFVTTMSVALSTYLFVPAIFTQVHPIAYISPISVVAAQIRHEAVPMASFLYSITPLTLASLVLASLAAALYREESLFAPRGLGAKFLDAVHRRLRTRTQFLLAGMLVLPFVFGAELFVLAFAVSLPLEAAIGFFLVGVAVVEELAKAVPSLAHYSRAAAPRNPWVVGGLVGLGFFIGEKVSLLFSLVGLDLIPLGNKLLASYGVSTSIFLIAAPLALHVVTATLTAHAARRGRLWLLAALPVAILVHVLYNWTVIRNVA